MADNKPTEESAGSNLSYPVIWAEGVTKALRTPPDGQPQLLDGEWWYWWGYEGSQLDLIPQSCPRIRMMNCIAMMEKSALLERAPLQLH